MAMTVRFPEELDRRLAEAAAVQHVSKHALVLEAVRRLTSEETKTREVVRLTEEVSAEYSELFTRLEDA